MVPPKVGTALVDLNLRQSMTHLLAAGANLDPKPEGAQATPPKKAESGAREREPPSGVLRRSKERLSDSGVTSHRAGV